MTTKVAGLTLRDIMTREVVTVSPESTIREVVELLVSHGISGAPVTSGNRVVGVVSASDLLEFESSRITAPAARDNASDWREELEPDWKEGDESSDYFSSMWEDGGADVFERFRSAAGPEWDVLEEHTATEVMTRAVHALAAGTGVSEAARYMIAAKIHRVLVMSDDVLEGLVTTTDVMRAVAEGRI